MAPLIGFGKVWECDSDVGSITVATGCCPTLAGSQVSCLKLAATGNSPKRTRAILPLRSLITQ